ncbi:MAG: 30S ribosome-binding factor RbfA [Acidobacteriia bacterium]|nr:30S ribosome-binding factor RbfA [Terriglobia bacterium]
MDHRVARVTATLQTELEEIINYELDDPRIGTVSVTEVLLSPDKKKAHVRLALSGDRKQQEATMEAIGRARGFLRHAVAERLELFRAPDLAFTADIPFTVREKAGKLLKKIKKGRPRDPVQEGTRTDLQS